LERAITLIFRGITLQRSRKNLNLALLTLVTLAPFVRSDLALDAAGVSGTELSLASFLTLSLLPPIMDDMGRLDE